jgi:hypothetical protein
MVGEMAASRKWRKARRVDLFSLSQGEKNFFLLESEGGFWGERKIIYDGSFAV